MPKPPSAQRSKSRTDAARYSASCGKSGASSRIDSHDGLDERACRRVVRRLRDGPVLRLQRLQSGGGILQSQPGRAGLHGRGAEVSRVLDDLGFADDGLGRSAWCVADGHGNLRSDRFGCVRMRRFYGKDSGHIEPAPETILARSGRADIVAECMRQMRRTASPTRHASTTRWTPASSERSPATLAPPSPNSPRPSDSRSRRCRRDCAGSRSRGIIVGYRAVLDAEAIGRPLSAFIEITPLDPAQPDNAPELLEHLTAIEACHSDRGRRELHALRPGRDAAGPRGADPRHPARGIRQHPDHDRPADLLRAPPDRTGRPASRVGRR